MFIKLIQDISWLNNGDGGFMAPFIEMVKETGSALFVLFMVIGVVVLLAGIFMCAIKLILGSGRNGTKREEGKENLPWVVVGGVMIFGSIGIIVGLMGLGKSIADTLMQQVEVGTVIIQNIQLF